MATYRPTVGLEIHAELRTETKMFCNSKNDVSESRPNVNICPVCMGHPGTLPTINKEAVKHVLTVGLALGGNIADYTEFDRKNYFYPDIPKGYQLSQYKYPLVSGGVLSGISVTRVHLEEDTARSQHEGGVSLVDFNRAGVPLMELVTEPVIHDAVTAGRFARELQLLLRTLGVSHANMEKGEMRVEANISISANEKFGTKVEVKNLNSFRSVERAIEYEIARQTEILEKGEQVIQETRGWDEIKQVTFSQRLKETSEDYRYFPDPDLPKLILSEIPEFSRELLLKAMPELPTQKRNRYAKEFGLKESDIEIFVTDPHTGNFFEETIRKNNLSGKAIQLTANYITSDLAGLRKGGDIPSTISPENFGTLITLVEAGKVTSRNAKDLLAIMVTEGGDPEVLAQKKGLTNSLDEGALVEIVGRVVAGNSKAVGEFKAGKEASLQFLIGQLMKETKGTVSPEILKKALMTELAK